MGAALEQRADINGRAADVSRVLCPGVQLFERAGRGLPVVLVRAAAQAQRIDVIEYCIVIPSHCLYRSRLILIQKKLLPPVWNSDKDSIA